MSEIEVAIDGDRLIADLRTLRGFGARGTGVVRTALSPVDIESRRWLCARLSEAGLDAGIDGAGNVLGRSPNPGGAVIVGSHTDTQPTGGWLDGAMGVIYGLEVARALSETPATRHLAVDVASWLDEEGRFCGCFGSLSFVGETPSGALDSLDSTDGTGLTLGQALREAGLEGVAPQRLDPERHVAYLEAHIEQGPWLEDEGNRIGVVTSIVGSRNFTVEFDGEQNHAGTTPMGRRRDAAHAMVEFAHSIFGEFSAAADERTVWTIGEMTLEPNAMSIVPGRARLNLQFRDQDTAVLDRLESLARDLLARANEGPCERRHARAEAPLRPRPDGRAPARPPRARRRTARAGALDVDAERRSARRADPRAPPAERNALRAEHQRREPCVRGGHQRGGHRARMPGAGQRDGIGARLVRLNGSAQMAQHRALRAPTMAWTAIRIPRDFRDDIRGMPERGKIDTARTPTARQEADDPHRPACS